MTLISLQWYDWIVFNNNMIELNDNKKTVFAWCALAIAAPPHLALLKETSVTRFWCLLIPIHVRKKIWSHIEIVKNDIQCNIKEITICPDSMYLSIPAIAMYGQNWCTWDNHQPRHVYINSNVTDSTWCTYNNHLLLYVNTDSIASKTSCTYHVKLLATTLLIPLFFT